MNDFEKYWLRKETHDLAAKAEELGFDDETLEIWLEARYPQLHAAYNTLNENEEPDSALDPNAFGDEVNKALKFFDKVADVLDADHSHALATGDEVEGWTSAQGGENAFQDYIADNIHTLAIYFGTNNPAEIRKQAAKVARKKRPLKKGDDPAYTGLLDGLADAYRKAQGEKRSKKSMQRVDFHFDDLRRVLNTLRRDLHQFAGLYSMHRGNDFAPNIPV
jgi:hypothetical protein